MPRSRWRERNRDERKHLTLQRFVARNQRKGVTRCVGESPRGLPRRHGVGMRSKEQPELLDRILRTSPAERSRAKWRW